MAKAIKKSVSLPEELMSVVENFPSRHHGLEEFSTKLQEIISDFAAMIGRTKREVLEILTEAEMNYLRDLLNSSLIYADQFPVRTILAGSIEDGDKYEGLGEKWGVNVPALVQKVKNMAEFQAYTAVKMVDEYWNGEKEEE